ncbi:uncharacterized protein LOC104583349 [Brachypodium distachyon]|nr:uncharacterized protein LOC104583349 [Brachypodium distachyon]|eukprot:XP_014754139.1 uncharacterized protein LOC104583349 [Brachypodium distachyon]
MASAATRFLLVLALAEFLLRPSAAEITQDVFKVDLRKSILLQRFGFTSRGAVSISVSGAKASSQLDKPDLHQYGFFLLSDEALFQAISSQPLPAGLILDPNQGCVLSSPYINSLFSFADLDDNGHYNRTFPVTHADEYSLFFANCAPQASVIMEVRIEMYNVNLDGTKDYGFSIGQAPVPTRGTTSASLWMVTRKKLLSWLSAGRSLSSRVLRGDA